MNAKVRLGIVGVGGATRQMMPSILAHPRVALIAAADPDAEARQRFATEYGVAVHASDEELCDRTDIDAVYIASPHQHHLQNVVTATAAGKHVLVEKPMALALDDCTAMIGAAERAGVFLIVGHTHNFDAPYVRMRELIAGGTVGALAMISAFAYTNFLYRPRRPEELDTARGGGVMFNQAPHQVDIARYLAGPVASVRAITTRLDPARPTEGGYTAFLQFASGAAASLVYSGYDYFDSDELHGWVGEMGEGKAPGQHGSARAVLRDLPDGGEAALKRRAAARGRMQPPAAGWHHPHFGIVIASCTRADLRASPDGVLVYGPEGVQEITVPCRAYPDKTRALDELADAVLDGKPPLRDGRWGRATMEVCLAMLQSAAEGQEVKLQL